MSKQRIPVEWGLVALAAVVRLVGISWGLPDGTHFFSYHPDEFETAGRVLQILETGRWDPEFFAYGSFYLYLTTLLAWPFRLIGWVETVTEAHVAARLVTVLLASGTVLFSYRLTERLRGRAAAGIAGALVALAPGHVLHSHFATVDVTATFLMTACLYWAVRAGPKSMSAFILAAGVAGFATATKYNAGIVVVAPLVVLLSDSRIPPGRRIRTVGLMAAAGLAAFLAAVPYAILDFETFRNHAAFEIFQHPREGHANVFVNTGNGWWYHATRNLPYALGIPALLIATFGAALVVRDRRREELALLAFAAVYFFGIGISNVRFLRYALPIIPVLAFAAAVVATGVVRRQRNPMAMRAVGGVAIGSVAILTTLQLIPLTRPDPRDAAFAWLAPQVPGGSSVGIVGIPWFSHPPVTTWNGGERTRARYESGTPVRIVACEDWDVTKLSAERPEWFLISEFDTREEIRLQEAPALAFIQALHSGWREVASFEGMSMGRRRLFGGYAPHDWLYPYASVTVYRIRGD